MLLKDSLGGNSKTVMFANLGPSDKNISESISTLRFALRAKQIENKPIKNLDPKDARIQELMDKIEELQRRLGGADLNEEERLKSRIEELEVENADLRGGTEKDTLELEELVKSKQAQIDQLVDAVKQRDVDLQRAVESRAILESNQRSDAEHMHELKSVNINFIKRVCSEQQLQMIKSRMPRDGEYNLSDDGWDLREIQFYLEGFLDVYERWRQTAFTQEDLQRHIAKATEELQAQFQRQLSDIAHSNDELLRLKTEEAQKRAADNESQSHLKVEFAAVKEENAKLREKIERDQEKMRKKLDKNKEEAKLLQDEIDGLKSQVAVMQRDAEKLKKLLEESGMKQPGAAGGQGSFSGAGSPGKWSDEKNALQQQLEDAKNAKNQLESRLKETNVALRRKGFCLKDKATLPGGVGESVDDAGTHNEAFILTAAEDEAPIDGDLLGQLQQQIRIQHRLHELRHVHQRKLDDMVRKFELLKTGKVTPNSVEGSVSEELLAAKIAEAIRAKEEELATSRAEFEKTTDKLVKKLNREASRCKELEKNAFDEKAGFDEERTELLGQNTELQKFNQQLSLEVETLRGQLNNIRSENESSLRLKDAEISHLKNEIAQLVANGESSKSKSLELEQLQQEHQRLIQQNQRTEASLKEKIATLDNNRQMIKWSNSLLETEKKKVQEAQDQLKSQEAQFREMEENWRAQLIENANKLVAINNKRLEEQAAQYQSLVTEEQEKQKVLREKLKKAKAATQKSAQRYDEMVLENESLLVQLEDLKVSAMKIFREKQEAQRDLDAFKPSNFSGPRRL